GTPAVAGSLPGRPDSRREDGQRFDLAPLRLVQESRRKGGRPSRCGVCSDGRFDGDGPRSRRGLMDLMGATAEVPKTHLVVLALHALGGEGDLETIAVKAHEMFPGQFSWRRFPFPDKDAVRVHLS